MADTAEKTAYTLPVSLMNPLESCIGYKFRNSLLLAEAMTHPSISLERRDYLFDNQRLEFLGDSVLQLVITEFLYSRFPDANEGQMTKMRTCLVSRHALKEQAQSLQLGHYLMMGKGEESNGGRKRESNLGDAFEALLGAMYLDGGLEIAKRFILKQAHHIIQTIEDAPSESNPKGQLQEALQALHPHAPVYELLQEVGPEHAKHFTARVIWQGTELARGTGQSKKEAEVAAARLALSRKLWEHAPKSMFSEKP